MTKAIVNGRLCLVAGKRDPGWRMPVLDTRRTAYYVELSGRILSVDKRTGEAVPLKVRMPGKGREPTVRLRSRRRMQVKRLVALALFGRACLVFSADRDRVIHVNGDAADCRASNIALDIEPDDVDERVMSE